jgi:FkbM family methyltransferase
MASVLTNFKTLLHFVALRWRHRKVYASNLQAGKALLIRLCFTEVGRKLVADRLVTLHLRGIDRPLHLRRCQSDYLLVEDIFENQEYAGVKQWNIPSDAAIVDLGANVGLASVYFSSLYPGCRIVAVEPDGGNLAVYRLNNAARIEQGRVSIEEGFVAAQDGVAGIHRTLEALGFSKVPLRGHSGEAVRCVSMPSLMDKHKLTEIDLLKCDIEGAESELFKNASLWIAHVRHLVVEVHPPYGLEDLYADLRAAGWNFHVTKSFYRAKFGICFLQQLPETSGPLSPVKDESQRARP